MLGSATTDPIPQGPKVFVIECQPQNLLIKIDSIKAAELLTKICGYNEPERVNVQSVEVKVDAALIQQLRAGYGEMSAMRKGEPKQLAASGSGQQPHACRLAQVKHMTIRSGSPRKNYPV